MLWAPTGLVARKAKELTGESFLHSFSPFLFPCLHCLEKAPVTGGGGVAGVIGSECEVPFPASTLVTSKHVTTSTTTVHTRRYVPRYTTMPTRTRRYTVELPRLSAAASTVSTTCQCRQFAVRLLRSVRCCCQCLPTDGTFHS